MGYAIAQRVDTDIADLYTGLTTTDVGTYGTDITDATVLAAIETLELNDVPAEDRAFVVDPTQKTALMKIDKFVRADYLGEYQSAKPAVTGHGAGTSNMRYLFGDIYGIPTYWTNQVATTAGTPTQLHNMLFHKEAFALALQQAPRVQSSYILEYIGNLVVVDIIYGRTTIRATFGVEVRS
mgnify:CR=1 FL=1